MGIGVLTTAVIATPPDYPDWWTAQNVLKPGAAADDYAAINQGQLKNLTFGAFKFVNASPFFSLAQKQKIQLHIDGFTVVTNGVRLPKISPNTENYAVATLGQLKAMAKPFYEQFYLLGWSAAFPWPAKGGADDYAVANIGQAKNLFNFDFQDDADGDGVPDVVETRLGTNPQLGDSDSDGLNDLDEGLSGANPKKKDHPAVGLTAFGFTTP